MRIDVDRAIVIDIDGTLAIENPALAYADLAPIPEAVAAVNELVARGWHVTLYTGRHHLWLADTQKWLDQYGVRYDHLVLGKPPARWYVDDRTLNPEQGWSAILAHIGDP